MASADVTDLFDAFYVFSQRIDLIAKPRRLSQSVYKSPFYGVARDEAEVFHHRGKGLYVAWFSALRFLILCLEYSVRVKSTGRSIKREENGIIVALFLSSVENFKQIGETNKFSGQYYFVHFRTLKFPINEYHYRP